ncbi:Uncharacterised protein g7339 [Pycnogonum litorale]
MIHSIDNDAFRYLQFLKFLSLPGNKLTELPDGAFKDLAKIENLDLRSNNLTRLNSSGLPERNGEFQIYLFGNEYMKSESGIDVKSGCPNDIVKKLKSELEQYCYRYSNDEPIYCC